MAKSKEVKTNAMRILDSMKINYEAKTYECKDFVDGVQIADILGLPHEIVYKTLVAQGASKQYYVYVIPIEAELDLKRRLGRWEKNPSPCCMSRTSTP